jgi:hypothetical protein
MRKKGGNFFEEHVEKIVLAIVVVVCIWLMITRVVISPNKIEYNGDKLGPGEIDISISREAEVLKEKLDSKPEPLPPYKQRVDDFIRLVDSPIGDIDTGLYWPLPIYSSTDITDKRKYRIPWIGEVADVAIEYIRAVAYVPTIEIDEENRYESTVCEPNDIDFVTVEAKFDVTGLYGRFYDKFAGDGVEQEEWRDPCLAIPVFAAVQLQRQELGDDGSWSGWQIVPRTKIDPRKKLFESVEEVEGLPPGGIKVRLLKFDDAEVRMALLQPEAYKIASAKEEWFPPLLHKKYLEQRQSIEVEKKRRARDEERKQREEEREKAREEREKSREDRRSGSLETGTSRRGSDRGTSRQDRFGSRLSRDSRTRRGDRSETYGESEASARRQEREEREKEREARLAKLRAATQITTLDDIYKEMDEILILKRTNPATLREPLVFWAHDDSVEPQKSYRYRIRLGVFNPVARTNQVDEQDKDLKDQIVLWSEFSDITGIVSVPGTLYFFPRSIQEAGKVVTVQVAKYMLDYWYSKDFAVKSGEVIGKVADFEPVEVEAKERAMPSMVTSVLPDTIDYGTGAVLVDVVPVNDWSGGRNMYARHYYDMLYSFDGNSIERIPINPMYWEEGLKTKLNEIKDFQKEPREPLRGWDTQPAGWESLPELEYQYEEPVDISDESRRPRRRTR